MNANLSAQLYAAVKDVSRAAILLPHREHVSYRDLFERVGRVANALVGAGLQPGDRLAAQIEKSVDGIVLYLATVRAGGVFLPLNIAYTPAEMEYFLADAEPRMVVLDPTRIDRLTACAKRLGSIMLTLDAEGRGTLTERAQSASNDFAAVPRSGDDLAAILYTSGTTGRSKGAMLTHNNLGSNAQALRDVWQFSKRDVLIHALPIFHTHGLFVATNVTLFAGASMIFLPRFDAAEIVNLLPQATCLMGVPTFYTRLLAEPSLTREAAKHIRLFVSGSAPLLAETHSKWLEYTGHSILERYGMTETNMNASNPYAGERVPGAVGFPLPGITIRIVDRDSDRELPTGSIGMIEVKGPNVFGGYWRMPEKTAAELRPDGYFITGDLGYFDKRGYLHIVGRGKDLIITGGYNVYPKEIETEIDALPGIVESAVFGVPHSDFGEAVVAAVVRRETDIDLSMIQSLLAHRLAKYKLPKTIVFLSELPRNAMGKVQKNVLREDFLRVEDIAE